MIHAIINVFVPPVSASEFCLPLRLRKFFFKDTFDGKHGGILISISMSNLPREKWENLNGYVCAHLQESGPKCRYVRPEVGQPAP